MLLRLACPCDARFPLRMEKKQKSLSVGREEGMFEYLAYALLGLALIGSLLYVTLSPETEDPSKPKRPDPKK
jgi:hypothetical protein